MYLRLRWTLLVAAALFVVPCLCAYGVGYWHGADAQDRYILRQLNAELQDAVLARHPFFLKDIDIKFIPRKADKAVNVQIAGAGADVKVRPQ